MSHVRSDHGDRIAKLVTEMPERVLVDVADRDTPALGYEAAYDRESDSGRPTCYDRDLAVVPSLEYRAGWHLFTLLPRSGQPLLTPGTGTVTANRTAMSIG